MSWYLAGMARVFSRVELLLSLLFSGPPPTLRPGPCVRTEASGAPSPAPDSGPGETGRANIVKLKMGWEGPTLK